MITHYPFATLGKADHGWLKANHHFSFAQYYNPNRMGFGTLRVVNDDWVKPGSGFGMHPHQDMEIITFVRSGEVAHEDNHGNKGKTKAGQVQVMSAGTGVFHSEFNHSEDPLTLYQIWITPNALRVQPRWDAQDFPATVSNDHLPLLVSGYEEDKNDALFIHQNARIFGGKVEKGSQFEHAITHQAYVLASDGKFSVKAKGQAETLTKGDGAEVTDSDTLVIEALEDSEIVIIDAPLA